MMDNYNWIQEIDETYHAGIRVLCFDDYNYAGEEVHEVWTVTIPEDDLNYIWDEIDSGYRPKGQAGVTQDCLANYDSEHFDKGTVGYDIYLGEVRRGEWIPEVEWLEANYRNR